MDIWIALLIEPTLNILIVLSGLFFHNVGIAIIVFTILVRLALLPLTVKQLRSSKAMSDSMATLRPKLKQLEKKYPKDQMKRQQEMMNIYKEAGISPMGCLSGTMLPMLIQLPIWIALFQAILQSLSRAPQDLLGLSDYLYSWSMVHDALPLSGNFLWLHLGMPDSYLIMPLLVMGTMFISQKMMIRPSTDPQQQSMNRMMLIMMPMMFGVITMTVPSGLALYWLFSNIISIVIQYFIFGWGGLISKASVEGSPDQNSIEPKKQSAEISQTQSSPASKRKEKSDDGKSRSKRKNSGRSC